MRIIIASQPKTGNVWIRRLLAEIYGLADLNESLDDKIPKNGVAFFHFVEQGLFPDDSIIQEHYFPNPTRVIKPARKIGARLVTMLRNPYDAFVSFFHYVNNFPERFTKNPASVLIGKTIDHPDVLGYVEDHFREHLKLSLKWVQSGASIIIRYEDLLADPVVTLEELTGLIHSVERCRIEEVVGGNSADRMKAQGGWLAKHVRSGSVGDWKTQLSEAHIEAFRRCHGDTIRFIGYAVY
ncbi:MAG: sulfotransferase domain-containing protein [Methylococcales bacterium]